MADTEYSNLSGIEPLEFKVLVLPDPVEKKTAGGIYLPEQAHEMEELHQVKATLIAKGGNAFEDWVDKEKLIPGRRVYISMHAGYYVEGIDGKRYKIISDKDVAGIITDEKE